MQCISVITVLIISLFCEQDSIRHKKLKTWYLNSSWQDKPVHKFAEVHVEGYKNYTPLNNIIFTNIQQEPESVHSEYFFGKCASIYKTLIVHDHMTYEDIKGKIIVRRWINVDTKPTCAYVRANSSYADIVRYHSFKFGMCFGTLGYVHSGEKFVFHFYEWYIPVEMMKGIDWDLYFYVT